MLADSKASVYHEFISFCCKNESKQLMDLVSEFKTSIHGREFNFSEFLTWKQEIEYNQVLMTQFYSYPFLRDYSFISFLGSLKEMNGFVSSDASSFDKFILRAQIEYFSHQIDDKFRFNYVKTSGNASTAAKCPFASKTIKKDHLEEPSFVIDRELSKIKCSRIHSIRIYSGKGSNFQLSPPTSDLKSFNVRLGTFSDFKSDDLTILTSASESSFPVFDSGTFILASDTKFVATSLPDELESNRSVLQELARLDYSFSAADIAFLFPNNAHVVKPGNVDLILNILVYLNILNLSCDLETIKKVLPASQAQSTPSFLQPYSDVLTPEYIKNNPELFVSI